MQSVHLSPAYVWDCPECGRENFQRTVSVVLRAGENTGDEEIIRHLGGLDAHDPIPKGMQVVAQSRPDRVTCRHCNVEFGAVDTHAYEPDGEGD